MSEDGGDEVIMEQISVYELRKHWEALDALSEGGGSVEIIPLSCMPPWNDLCSELNWETHLVDDRFFGKKHHGYCGVYRLIGLASEGDLTKPAVFGRLCGQDTTGTLYIGKADSLNNRLNQLRRSLLSRHEESHETIGMLKRIPLLNFLLNKLAVALLFTGRCSRSVEGDLIQAYMNSFGDAPPLNYRK
jgi:hypothetical protein